MAGRPSKRKALDITAECMEHEHGKMQGSFLILELEENKPFKSRGWPWVQAGLRGILGTEKAEQVKFVKEGLLVKTKNGEQTRKLLRATLFGDQAVKVSKHGKLNQSRGTIYAEDLKELEESEVVEWLREYGVTDVKQVWRKEGNRVVKTPLFEITFDKHVPPETIKLDYVSYEVRRSYPRPLQCQACGRLGHHHAVCRARPTCLRCGEEKHGTGHLTCDMKCINCSGNDHVSMNNRCPRITEEREVIKIKVDRGMTHMEARKVVQEKNNKMTKVTYATAAASNTTAATVGNMSATINQRLDKLEACLMSVMEMVKDVVKGAHVAEGKSGAVSGKQSGDVEKVVSETGDMMTVGTAGPSVSREESDDRHGVNESLPVASASTVIEGSTEKSQALEGGMGKEMNNKNDDQEKSQSIEVISHPLQGQGCVVPSAEKEAPEDSAQNTDESAGPWQTPKPRRGGRGGRRAGAGQVEKRTPALTPGSPVFSARTLEELEKMQEEEFFDS